MPSPHLPLLQVVHQIYWLHWGRGCIWRALVIVDRGSGSWKALSIDRRKELGSQQQPTRFRASDSMQWFVFVETKKYDDTSKAFTMCRWVAVVISWRLCSIGGGRGGVLNLLMLPSTEFCTVFTESCRAVQCHSIQSMSTIGVHYST